MNSVTLTGRVTKDLELSQTSSAEPKTYCKFSLAVERPVKGTGTDFIGCVIWGKSAENFAKFVGKGQKVLVQGRWTTGSYQGKNGKVFTNECAIEKWEFADGKKSDGDNSGGLADGGEDTSIPNNLDFMAFNGAEDVPFN